MKRLLATALLSTLCLSAHASWENLYKGDIGKDEPLWYFVYYDSDAIKRDKDQVTFWILSDYPSGNGEDLKGVVFSFVTQHKIDCAANTQQLLFQEVVYGSMGKGKLMRKRVTPSVAEPITPNGNDAYRAKFFCDKK